MSTVEPGGELPVGAPGPTVLRMVLGIPAAPAACRRRRHARAGRRGDRASRTKISRMELGQVGFKERDVGDLLTLYGVSDDGTEREAGMLTLVAQANESGWWPNYDRRDARLVPGVPRAGGGGLGDPEVRGAVRSRAPAERRLCPCGDPARLQAARRSAIARRVRQRLTRPGCSQPRSRRGSGPSSTRPR